MKCKLEKKLVTVITLPLSAISRKGKRKSGHKAVTARGKHSDTLK